MADGSAAPSAGGIIGWRARLNVGTTVLNTPAPHILKARSWPRTSAAVISRPVGEGHWRSNQHRVGLNLTSKEKTTLQIEGGHVKQIDATAPRRLAFLPAGVGVRSAVLGPSFTVAEILQDSETYLDLASEVSAPVGLAGLEPMISIDAPQAALLIEAIVNEIEGGFFDHLLVNALSTALAVQLARHIHGSAVRLLPPGKLSCARRKRVLDYVEMHLGEPLSVSEMAAIACLSPFHFSRSFKRSIGMSLHRYVLARRIERARQLVLQTDLPLTDIAAATGFDSQASFTVRFRRELGVTPGKLRRSRG